jgi:2-oxoisovalerate dehydrogenase E1 component alpha subunit
MFHPESGIPVTGESTKINVPDAPFRPGDSPWFGRFQEQPEDLTRPSILAAAENMQDHAWGMVRVLDDEGHALGTWNPHLPADTLRSALAVMTRVRAFDSRLLMMQRQGKISFYLESKGEEAVAIGAGFALHREDQLFPYYRQQGLFFVRGMSMVDMICHCIGNVKDVVKGRQMPIHYTYKAGNIVSISSPVATQFPQAVGAAMAFALKNEDRVAATWIGDGSSAEGDFHEALVFASVFKPPVILNVVNNQWAISTPCTFANGGRTFAARGIPFGIPSIRVDGNDFLAVYAVTEWASDRARQGHGPTLIELVTYRAGAHSSSDDPTRYRAAGEYEQWPGGDPLRRLTDHLIQLGEWSEAQQAELVARCEAEVLAAYKEAESHGTAGAGPFPPAASIFDDVYAELPWHLREQRRQAGLD